jgi:hypothetical protein
MIRLRGKVDLDLPLQKGKAEIEISAQELANQMSAKDFYDFQQAFFEFFDKKPQKECSCKEPKPPFSPKFHNNCIICGLPIPEDADSKFKDDKVFEPKPISQRKVERLIYYTDINTGKKCLFPKEDEVIDKINEIIDRINGKE